jgi:hypothetical protein
MNVFWHPQGHKAVSQWGGVTDGSVIKCFVVVWGQSIGPCSYNNSNNDISINNYNNDNNDNNNCNFTFPVRRLGEQLQGTLHMAVDLLK